ncbi:hypothetical protein UL57_25165, partial [Shigella boydii]
LCKQTVTIAQMIKGHSLTSRQRAAVKQTLEEVQHLLLRLPPSCAPKLEVTSPTWQPLTLFLLCV